MIGNALHYSGSDWMIERGDLSDALREALLDCGARGDASEAVAFVRSQFTVTGEEEACRAYLSGYGAWEDDELADHDANLDRLVWLTGCGMREEGSAYFSAY